MENRIILVLDSDLQVFEKMYESMRHPKFIKRTRTISLFFIFLFLSFSGIIFHLAGLQFYLALVLIFPSIICYLISPWLRWRLSCVAYKAAFPPLKKIVTFNDCSIKIEKFSSNKNSGSSVINIRDVVRVIDDSRSVVIFTNDSVELLPKKQLNESMLDVISKFSVGVDKANPPDLYSPPWF